MPDKPFDFTLPELPDFNISIPQEILNPPVLTFDYDKYQRQFNRANEEALESIEAGRREFAELIAEKNAEAYVKAQRTSPVMYDKVISALSSLCGNPTYNPSVSEDSMNDYVRDLLERNAEVRDQTRQGISSRSTSAEEGNAGEIDIQIRHNGKPICIYEGLKLNSVSKAIIQEHIIKASVKYNPQGVKDIFVVVL